MDFVPPFGQWLKVRRQQLGMTQGDLARRVGCAAITIRKLEAGARQPSRLVAERLGERLEVPDTRHTAFVTFATGAQSQLDAPHRGSVPAVSTPLIGRAAELALARKLLRRPEVRLITLVGPPGVGKTRLVQKVATDAMGRFADGAWFVALASITDPDLVIPTVAMTVDARLDADQTPLVGLKHYLRDRHLLLVLDNFEQLLDGAQQVAVLLAAAPNLKVLVTSRTPLHITGEHELPVPPLALPNRQGRQSVDALARCPSVQLFLQRAQAVKPNFVLDGANVAAVAEICRRLDGLPLAIELAATRIKMMTPQTLLAELVPSQHSMMGTDGKDRPPFPLLSGGPRDLLQRQQTLWDTIDWSYRLLSVEEQQVFRQLGVFVGGCTLEAAAAVCNVGSSLITHLQSLIDKSLLQQEEDIVGVARFVMLELIHQYASARLEASDEADAVRRRHAEYITRLTEPAHTLHTTREAGSIEWAKRLDAEFGNLHAALVWSQVTTNQLQMEVILAANMASFLGFCVPEGRPRSTPETRALLARTLGRSRSAPAGLRAKLLHGLIELAHWDANYVQAIVLSEESAALYRQAGDHAGEAAALRELGYMAYEQNDFAYAARIQESSLRLWSELGDEYNAAITRFYIAGIALDQGRLVEAVAIYEDVLATCHRLGAANIPKGVASDCLMMLGLIAQLQGHTERAISLEEECLQISQDAYARPQVVWALLYLGRAALQLGQLDRALASIKESLTFFRDALNLRTVIKVIAIELDEMAAVRWAQQRTREAVTLVASADPMRRALGAVTPFTGLTADHERMLALIRPLLEDSQFALAWDTGVAMSVEQAVEYALAGD